MKNKKKIAAASAVLAYIKEEEEVAGAMAMQASAGIQPLASPHQQLSMWGLSGRQTQMQLRNMMQAKAFHGFRHH